jgi:hypothetical protein
LCTFSKISLNTSKSPKGKNVQNLLLSGIADLESRVAKIANQAIDSLFIGAENLASLARCSCSIPCIKPLPAFAIVVEGSLIFNFALDPKVQFSLKIQRKFILKTASAKYKRLGTPRRAMSRRRARPRRPPAVRAVPASGARAEALE